jgi:hypothetical protein
LCVVDCSLTVIIYLKIKRHYKIINKIINTIMGIQYDAILCYGIEFSYDDIVHLKDTIEFKQLAQDIGTDNNGKFME